MKNVQPALLATQRVVAQADIENDGALGLGQIGDGQEILKLEIGDDGGRPAGEDFFRLGRDVPVGREDVLGQRVFLIDEEPALIVVRVGETRALDSIVGQDFVDERERNVLLIFLGEIVNWDLGDCRGIGRRAILGCAAKPANMARIAAQERKTV